MTNKTIIIGDLHGCKDDAERLIHACEVRLGDRVIFLGDVVDRGPDSAGCLDMIIRIEKNQGSKACVLGNHESKMLSYLDTGVALDKKKWSKIIPDHANTLAQLRHEHFDYMRSLPTYIRLPEHNIVCVHAGVWPGRAIEQQKQKHLLHIQSIRPYVDDNNVLSQDETSKWPSKVKHKESGWKFWTNFWSGPETIVFGHSVLDKPLITPHAIGLDGGCCHGRELWALTLPERKIVRVKSTVHVDSSSRKRTYEISPGVCTF